MITGCQVLGDPLCTRLKGQKEEGVLRHPRPGGPLPKLEAERRSRRRREGEILAFPRSCCSEPTGI